MGGGGGGGGKRDFGFKVRMGCGMLKITLGILGLRENPGRDDVIGDPLSYGNQDKDLTGSLILVLQLCRTKASNQG